MLHRSPIDHHWYKSWLDLCWTALIGIYPHCSSFGQQLLHPSLCFLSLHEVLYCFSPITLLGCSTCWPKADQCGSMRFNADQVKIYTNDDLWGSMQHWLTLIFIEKNWSLLRRTDLYWSAMISNGLYWATFWIKSGNLIFIDWHRRLIQHVLPKLRSAIFSALPGAYKMVAQA